jgi:hypothetical protein
MPGLVPGIHVFAAIQQQRRGWPGRKRSGRPPFFLRLADYGDDVQKPSSSKIPSNVHQAHNRQGETLPGANILLDRIFTLGEDSKYPVWSQAALEITKDRLAPLKVRRPSGPVKGRLALPLVSASGKGIETAPAVGAECAGSALGRARTRHLGTDTGPVQLERADWPHRRIRANRS